MNNSNRCMEGFSNNAHNLIMVATKLANFDSMELYKEIFTIQRNKAAKVTEPTVLQAMSNVSLRHGGKG